MFLGNHSNPPLAQIPLCRQLASARPNFAACLITLSLAPKDVNGLILLIDKRLIPERLSESCSEAHANMSFPMPAAACTRLSSGRSPQNPTISGHFKTDVKNLPRTIILRAADPPKR